MKSNKKLLRGWTETETANFNKLTPQEQLYYKIMKPKAGVLMLMAKPGIAKSAMALNIADTMGAHYEDLRLSMADETDFKFPFIDKKQQGDAEYSVSDSAIPRWAFDANTRPTIIHFEELNRAPQFVRNAALQILLERQIGGFKFNDNVLMLASGNLGEEDGTDVEEFDNALKNRLITMNHTLAVKDWLNNFANKPVYEKVIGADGVETNDFVMKDNKKIKLGNKVQPTISEFIESNAEYLYKDPSEDQSAYATPRSWTFLSEFITTNYGYDAEPSDFLQDVSKVGMSYVGTSIQRFIRFCQEKVQLSIEDIINNFPKVEKALAKFGRDKYSELLTSLKKKDIDKFDAKQLKNVVLFLEKIDEDELMGYLLFVIDNEEVKSKNKKRLLKSFTNMLVKIKDFNNDDN